MDGKGRCLDNIFIERLWRSLKYECDYLSRLERDEVAPPSEEVLRLLAAELGVDTDVMLALGGKISADLRAAILARPKLFAELIRSLKDMLSCASYARLRMATGNKNRRASMPTLENNALAFRFP